MLQQGAMYRTPGSQFVQVRQEFVTRRWHLYVVATDQPAYLERDQRSALDRDSVKTPGIPKPRFL